MGSSPRKYVLVLLALLANLLVFSYFIKLGNQKIYSSEVDESDQVYINNSKKTIRIAVDFFDFQPTNKKPYWPFYDLLKDKYNIIYSKKPDFYFYGAAGKKSYPGSIRVYLGGENLVPNFNKCDYAISYNSIQFGDRHFKYFAHMYTEILFGPWDFHPKLNKSMVNRSFCSFIYGDHNQELEGVVKREQFFHLLSEYKKVDSPGKIFNNMEMPVGPRTERTKYVEQWRIDKHNFIKDYKFNIAFENTVEDGYITEKIADALYRHTIPIYFGDPNVGKYYNKKAFIDVNDYDSLEDVVNKVIELDNDDDAYMAMLNEPPFAGIEHRSYTELQDFLINIIENGKIFNKDPKGYSD